MEVVAYQGKTGTTTASKSLLALKKYGAGLQLLEASTDGQVLVGAFHDRLFLGVASQPGTGKLEDLQYEFYSFDIPDLITSLSLRVHKKSNSRKAQTGFDKAVDVVAGGARGAIYAYCDVLSRLQAAGKSQAAKDGVQVQRLHWHRRAVHAVKWSRDGMYCAFSSRSRARLTSNRKLHSLRWLRECPCLVASGHGQKGLPPASVGQCGKHCGLLVRVIICNSPRRQLLHDSIDCRDEADHVRVRHSIRGHRCGDAQGPLGEADLEHRGPSQATDPGCNQAFRPVKTSRLRR